MILTKMYINSYGVLFVPLLIIGLQSVADCAGSAAGNQTSNDRAPSAKQLVVTDGAQLPTYQAIPQQQLYPNYQPAPLYYNQPYYEPRRQRASRSRGIPYLLYLALSILADTTTITTTATTTAPTTTVSGCSYGPWSTCSSACLGTQTRNIVCSGVETTQSQNCNTQLGFLSNGWFRALNCYDYLVSETDEYTYDEGEAACEGMGGRLASTGIRDREIIFDLMEAFLKDIGQPVRFYPGADSSSGEWVWSDGVTVEPNMLVLVQPVSGIRDHLQMAIGNTRSGIYVNGNADRNYMCERAAQ